MSGRTLSIAIVLLLAGCGDAKKNFETGFKTAFEKNFTESCTKSAMDGGKVPADQKPAVLEFCGCVAKKLVERHSMTELASLGGGGSQEKIEAAATECAPKK
jgi:hypothetical protein